MSNISSAQKKLAVTDSKNANLDIENYDVDELVTILNISEPTEHNIRNASDFYIKKNVTCESFTFCRSPISR